MAQDIQLGIKLKFDGKDVEGGLSLSREQVRQFATEAKRAGEATSGSFTSAAKGVRSISAQLDQAKQAVIGYFTVTQAIAGARWIGEQASAMQQLEARLKVATSSAAEYARAQEGVFAVANRWGAAVEQTAGAFARLNPVVQQMGGNSATTLKMLDGLSASLRLSGATAAETSAVLLQFSQAMGSGRVGGDEFRSMMENAEPLMRAVAGEMGKTTAELRQMSEEGKLTSSVFGNALLPAIDKLAKQAGSIPMGIGQAWQVLENNLKKSFGKEFEGQTNAVGDAIKTMADHTLEAAAAVHALGTAVVEVGGFAAKAAGATAIGGAVVALNSMSVSAAAAATGVSTLSGSLAALMIQGGGLMTLINFATSPLGKAGILGATLWGSYSAAEFVIEAAGARQAINDALEPVFKALDKMAGIDRYKDAADAAAAAAAAAKASKAAGDTPSRLSAAGEYSKLVSEYKTRESLLKDHTENVTKILTAYRDKWGETKDKDRAALEKDVQQRLAASRAKLVADLQGLPEAKQAQQLMEAQANVRIALIKKGAEAEQAALAQQHAAGILDEKQYQDALTKIKQDAITAEIKVVGQLASKETDAAKRTELLGKMQELTAEWGIVAAEAATKIAEAEQKARAEIEKTRDDEIKQVEEAIAKRKEELTLLGLTEEQKDKMRAATLRASAAENELNASIYEQSAAWARCQADQEAAAVFYDKLAEKAATLAARQRSLADAEDQHGAKQASVDAAKRLQEAWKDGTDFVEHTLYDAISRGGKDGVEALKQTLKNAALKVVVNTIVQTSMGSMGQSLGVPSSGSMLGNAASSVGGSMIGDSLLSMGGSAVLSGSSLGGFMTGAGAALTNGAGIMGNLSAAGSLIGTGTAGGIATGIGMAMPYVAAALVIANAAGLFGKAGGPQSGQYGDISASGYKSSFTMSGGDSLGNQALAQSAYGQAAALFAMAGKDASGLTIGQGYKLDPQGSASGVAYRNISINGRTIAGGTFDGNNGAQWTGGNSDGSGAANYLGKLSTPEIQKLVDAIGDPAFSATVGKLAANFTDLNEGIIKYATAQAQQKSLVSAMMTEDERATLQLADAHKSLDTTFAALGRSVPATTAEMRDYINGLDLTTQAGQAAINKLAGVSDAFLLVANNAVKTEQTRAGWQMQLDILQGKYTQQQLDRFFQLIGTSDEATKSLMQHVWAMQDDAAAAQTAADALAAAADKARATAAKQRDLDIQLLDATGQTAAATAARRADALKALDNDQQRATQKAIWDAQDAAAAAQAASEAQAAAAQAAQQAAQEQARAQQQLVDGWQRTADAIMQTVRSLRGDLLGEEKSFAAAQADYTIAIAAAKAGDQTAAGQLPELARALVDLGKVNSTTATEQALLTARTAASLQDVVAGIGSKFGISVPAFEGGGSFGGGLRLVGENGPELEVTGPSRIFNARQTRSMMSGASDELLTVMRALLDENARLRSVIETRLAKIENNTLMTSKAVNGSPDGPMLVEVLA